MPCSWTKFQPQLFSIPGGNTVFQQTFVKAHSIMPGAMEGREDAETSLVALSANWEKKMCRIQLR